MYDKKAKIYVAGHNGLVGSAILRKLQAENYHNLVVRSHHELDLRDQAKVESFFTNEQPEYVFLAAAKVGGILANNYFPAEFIYDNLLIQANVIGMAHKYGVKKLMFLGSSCIYPKYTQQPIKESALLTGELESTNEPYAVAKIAGIKLCSAFNRQYGTAFMALMPCNLYGPNDNFDLQSSHVLPALIRKFHEAKIKKQEEVVVWGSGTPRREFLYVDDLADAAIFIMQRFCSRDIGEFINVGTGKDLTISDLAEIIKQVTGFKGKITYDAGKPDGTPRKLLDINRVQELGWMPKTSLEEGIKMTYEWALENSVFEEIK